MPALSILMNYTSRFLPAFDPYPFCRLGLMDAGRREGSACVCPGEDEPKCLPGMRICVDNLSDYKNFRTMDPLGNGNSKIREDMTIQTQITT